MKNLLCLLGYEEQFGDEGYDFDKELFDASHSEIAQLVYAIEDLSSDVRGKLYRLLYAKAITNLEAYLGDVLKKYVLTDEKYLRLYAEKYPPFAKEKLFDDMDVLREKVREALDGLLYHNIWKQKGIYREVLDVDFRERIGVLGTDDVSLWSVGKVFEERGEERKIV